MAIGRKRGRVEGPELDAPIAEAGNFQQEEVQPEVPEATPDVVKGKTRGKTTLQVIPTGELNRQTLEWNERGQPVGELSVRFSSTVGVIVREQVLINIDDWRNVEDKIKNEAWGILLQKYKLDLIHKTFILQQMGRLWRAYKSELSSSIMSVLDSQRNKTECTRLLNLLRPDDVPQKEWDAFVAQRSSEVWREMSDKMKAIRGRQLLPHTLSRKGYARNEHDHKKKTGESLCRTRSFLKGHEKSKNKYVLAKCAEIEAKLAEQPPNEGPVPVKYDVLSQVLGKEKNGRVRGLGAGVTPSRVDAQLQSSSWKQDFEEKLKAYSERTKILEDIIFELRGNASTTGGSGHAGCSNGGSKRTNSPDIAQDGYENGEKRLNPSPMTANSKSVQGSTLLGINQLCNILSWEGTDEVVAKGKISATDPATKVHGYKLGPDCYRVEIEEAVNPRAEFFRFQPEFSAMEDAVGSTIAWPIKYIVPRT